MSVGRPRKHNTGLPERVYKRRGSFFYVWPDGRWENCGKSEADLYKRLAEIKAAGKTGTMGAIFAEFLRELEADQSDDKLSPDTLRQYRNACAKMLPWCGDSCPDQIQPPDVLGYIRKRTAKVAANREKAFLSAAFSWAWRTGRVPKDFVNPCKGEGMRNAETRRDRYVSHAEVEAVGKYASAWLRRFLRVLYLTGQRPGDILRLTRQQITDSGIRIRQRKTGAGLLIQWSPALASAAQEALEHAGPMLVFGKGDRPRTAHALRSAWRRAINLALEKGDLAESFQMRDMRAKAGTDAQSMDLLGHAEGSRMREVYQRLPVPVKPTA